ncbi:glycoside hydrolase domain-containing protein [Streptomyces tendae]|uniref:glycoside hydrolase domain-containing protein n=1 Tax=Streptomyces tendae TaxID=1932 RepID=UPI00367A8823
MGLDHTIASNGLRCFPMYQTWNRSADDFSYGAGVHAALAAIDWAKFYGQPGRRRLPPARGHAGRRGVRLRDRDTGPPPRQDREPLLRKHRARQCPGQVRRPARDTGVPVSGRSAASR